MLLAAGSYAKARLPHDLSRGLNGMAWEAYHVATLTQNPHIVRSAVMAFLRETDVAFQRRAAGIATGFASMPDFEMDMTWEFSSWIPFVSGLLPKDTMTIRKRGSSIRMDSTLLGMSGLTWQRGDVSQIVTFQAGAGEGGEGGGRFLLLDNEDKTAGNGRDAFLMPEDKNVQDWVRKLFTTKQKASDWWSKDTRFEQAFVKGWLGGNTDQPKTADVGQWKGCTLYDMKGLKQTELAHNALAKDIKLVDWWRPAYEAGKWGPLELGTKQAHEVDLTQHSSELVEDRPETGMAQLQSALASAAGQSSDAAAAAVAAATGGGDAAQGITGAAAGAPTVEAVSFVRHFRGKGSGSVLEFDEVNRNYGVRGLRLLRGNADVDAEAVDEVIAALGVQPVTGDAASSVADEAGTGTPGAAAAGGETPHGSAESHAAGKAARAGEHVASNYIGKIKEPNTALASKTPECQVAFHPGFPLTREQMLPIAAALARTGEHFQNFKRFFENRMPAEAGFPVRFVIPVAPTVSATITFGRCELTTPPADAFEVPADYAMGEYVEKGFIRQL